MDNIIISLLLFFIFFSIFFQVSKNDKSNKNIQVLISLGLFWIFSLEIKESADWDAYVLLFENKNSKIEYSFKVLTQIFKQFGLKFDHLYQFHIIIISLLLVNFIRKFNNNIFFIFGAYIIVYFVPITNQIRYYLAFSLFINANYYFYIKRNTKLGWLLFITSIISHSAIIPLMLFNIFIKKPKRIDYIKILFILSLLLFSLSFLLQLLGVMNYLQKYAVYFSKEGTSSILGGIFNNFPYYIMILLLYFHNRKLIKNKPEIKNDEKYKLLYGLSFFPIIFLLISIYFQVLNHRYILPFSIVWFCFYLYPYQRSKNASLLLHKISVSLAFFIMLFFYNYILSEYILGEKSLYLTEFIKSFNSIYYFK